MQSCGVQLVLWAQTFPLVQLMQVFSICASPHIYRFLYITINVLKIHNDTTEVVSFVIEYGRKLTIGELD